MYETANNIDGPGKVRSTILDKLRDAERHVAVLEAQLASAHVDLDVERTNSESLHRALDSLQVSVQVVLASQTCIS